MKKNSQTSFAGRKPKVVAVFSEPVSKELAERVKLAGADIGEIRMDLFRSHDIGIISRSINTIKNSGMDVILTIRKDIWQRRYRKDPEKRRLSWFNKLIPLVDFVDIEEEADEIREEVIARAKKEKKGVIYSYHNFNKTPERAHLEKILKRFINSGADILKIATMARNMSDALRLLGFVKLKSQGVKIVGISMGKGYEFTRILGGVLGSYLTYGYTNKTVAPGQLSVYELCDLIKLMYD